MTYNPDIHHRRSIRLKGYEYSQAGAYFVTVCTQNRECLLGEIVDGEMRLNDAGRMIQRIWHEIPVHYSGVEVDAFVVMPNHIHGVVILVGAAPRGRPDVGNAASDTGQARGPVPTMSSALSGQARGPAPTMSLPDVVHRFKTMTTKLYIDGVKQSGWSPFFNRLWQRNYYERIIRNEDSLARIREYIVNNPLQWALDRENPANVEANDSVGANNYSPLPWEER